MKFSLKSKFLFCYIAIIAATLGILNTYGLKMLNNRIIKDEQVTLYNQAELLASQYLTDNYFTSSSIPIIKKQFNLLTNMTGVNIMAVNINGSVYISSTVSEKNNLLGVNITKYDSTFLDNQTVTDTTINHLLDEKMIAVIYPVTSGIETKAYLVLLSPMANIHDKASSYMDNIVKCYLIISVGLFFIMALLYIQTILPIRQITKAVKEYAHGHFDYQIENISGRDMNDLAGAIRYMSDKMSDMNDYQKKFIANVSHDFRSPLTSIHGYTQAMLDGTIPPEMHEKYLDIILFETQRLTKLTSNLLALSQFENNGIPMDISTFDINYEIKLCSAAFEQRCTEKQISLSLIFDAKNLYVSADISKIEQVIQNLLDNAIKFSNQSSTIEIHTSKNNHKVFVSVKDHGIGIPKDSINKVWDRFYKSDLSRGKDKKGTGLGLSITKEIIESHGENINVISTEGVGTEFIFTLNEAEPPSETEQR